MPFNCYFFRFINFAYQKSSHLRFAPTKAIQITNLLQPLFLVWLFIFFI